MRLGVLNVLDAMTDIFTHPMGRTLEVAMQEAKLRVALHAQRRQLTESAAWRCYYRERFIGQVLALAYAGGMFWLIFKLAADYELLACIAALALYAAPLGLRFGYLMPLREKKVLP